MFCISYLDEHVVLSYFSEEMEKGLKVTAATQDENRPPTPDQASQNITQQKENRPSRPSSQYSDSNYHQKDRPEQNVRPAASVYKQELHSAPIVKTKVSCIYLISLTLPKYAEYGFQQHSITSKIHLGSMYLDQNNNVNGMILFHVLGIRNDMKLELNPTSGTARNCADYAKKVPDFYVTSHQYCVES
jgi:hypothetical protein